MKHKETYNRHQIVAETVKRDGGFVVNYQIDGGDIRASRGRPLKDERFSRALVVRYRPEADIRAHRDRLELPKASGALFCTQA